MVRKTLKSLESEIKELRESDTANNSLLYDYRKETENLKSEISNLKRDLENSISNEKKHCDILTTIVKILSGKSQLASKASVIEDLLRIEVDSEKESIKRMKDNPYQNSRGLF